MSSKTDLLNILTKVIEAATSGGLKAQVLENLINKLEVNFKLADKIQLAENINLNINLSRNEFNNFEAQPTLILTAKDRETKDTIQIQSENSSALTIKDNLFSSGMHIMIDQPSFWTNDDGFISYDYIKIFPVIPKKKIYIKTQKIGRDINFIFDEEKIIFDLWNGRKISFLINGLSNEREDEYQLNNYSINIKKHPANELLLFPKIPETIISFDTKLVDKVITMTRKHDFYEDEYFVFILALT